MKTIPVREAVGTVLCHDITRIVPGKCKEAAFRRGHIIREADVQTLLDIGKANLFVYDPRDGYIHEDDAAIRIANAACGQGVNLSSPVEGKVTVTAAHDGVLSINVQGLASLNRVPDVAFATIHTHQFVKKGRGLAGTRVIPLAVPEKNICNAEAVCSEYKPILEVKPLRSARAAIVTTGSEVYSGRIQDGFGPVLRRKFEALGSSVIGQAFVSDEKK